MLEMSELIPNLFIQHQQSRAQNKENAKLYKVI